MCNNFFVSEDLFSFLVCQEGDEEKTLCALFHKVDCPALSAGEAGGKESVSGCSVLKTDPEWVCPILGGGLLLDDMREEVPPWTPFSEG